MLFEVGIVSWFLSTSLNNDIEVDVIDHIHATSKSFQLVMDHK